MALREIQDGYQHPMSREKKRRLESAVASIHHLHGPQALRKARDLPKQKTPPHISTTFPQLDEVTGCGGIPLNALTLLSGKTTSGKLTLAYKTLAAAQKKRKSSVAILDLNQSCDPDYLERCGIDLARLLIVRPTIDQELGGLLLELVRSGEFRLLLVDHLADAQANAAANRSLRRSLGLLGQQLQRATCGVIFMGEPSPPWQRWINVDMTAPIRRSAALHLELRHERWLTHGVGLTGYRAQARILKSRWTPHRRSTKIEIVFNGVVRARDTW